MTKDEVFANYRHYKNNYDTAQHNYTIAQHKCENAVQSRHEANRQLEHMNNYRQMLQNRRDSIQVVIQDLSKTVSDKILEANQKACGMASSFMDAIFSGDGSLEQAPLETIFRTKSLEDDENSKDALRDCILERDLTNALIQAYDADIRKQTALIQDIQQQINQFSQAADGYRQAMNNSAYLRDEFWKSYQQL